MYFIQIDWGETAMGSFLTAFYASLIYLRKNTPVLDKWVSWGTVQLRYVLYLVMFAIIAIFIFKRQWLMLLWMMLALVFLAAFVNDPYLLIRLPQWLAKKLS